MLTASVGIRLLTSVCAYRPAVGTGGGPEGGSGLILAGRAWAWDHWQMSSKSHRRWTAGVWVSIVLGVAGGVAGVIAARGRPEHAPPHS